MNKTEIQARIDALQADFDSKLASLKADLAKCDCTDGIEQEKCWHAKDCAGDVRSATPMSKHDCFAIGCYQTGRRPAYMPECRQVTEYDFDRAFGPGCRYAVYSSKEFAEKLHDLGFRMKVTP